MLWMDADVGDSTGSRARLIPAGGDASPFPTGSEILPMLGLARPRPGCVLDELLRDIRTHTFQVVHADRLVYER